MHSSHLALLLVVVLLIVVYALAEQSFKPVDNNQYCRRKLSGSISNSGRTLKVDCRLDCRDDNNVVATSGDDNTKVATDDNKTPQNDDGRRKARVGFEMSTAVLPSFALRAMNKDSDSVAGFMSRFGFDRLIEYVESNATVGFQRDQDTIVKTMYLSNLRNKDAPWGAMKCSNVDQKDSTQPITCSSTIAPPSGSMISSMTLRATVTPLEVQVENEGVQKSKKILTPNSFKLDVIIDGITYSQANTRIAVGSFFVFKGTGNKQEKDSRSLQESEREERPDDVTENQGVVSIDEDSSATAPAGFFSWDRYISVKNANGTYTSKDITSSALMTDNDIDAEKDNDEDSEHKLMRVWFSPDSQVQNLLWDPSIGVTEEKVSSASHIMISTVVLMFVTLLYCL